MDRDIYTIKLEPHEKAQHILVKKDSFQDVSLKTKKNILSEITNICKKEYDCKECDPIHLENHSNDNIFLENGVLLINKLIKNISDNYLVFLRLKYPVVFEKKSAIKSDLIFTIFSPYNLGTFHKLQILSKLSRILNKNNIRKKITGALKAEDVIALLVTT